MSITDNARAAGAKVWSDFRSFSPGQKAVTVAAALALIIGGYVMLTWKSTPPYAPLFTNLAPSDASAIVDKLNSAGVPYQLAAAGTEIDVPASKVYAERIAISAAGLPSSTQTGYALLSKSGVTTSQFQQQISYQVGLETELGKTIQSINGVLNASVHLAIPQQSVFTDSSSKPTAAVLLTTAQGTTLTSGQVQAVVNLVSSSVPGMSADNVSVSDQNGNVLAAPGSGLSNLTQASTQAQLTQAYDNQLATQLQTMINRAIGPNRAVVNVNANLDFSKVDQTTQTYLYNKNTPPLSQSVTTETYSGSPNGVGGVLGAGTSGTTTTTSGGSGTSKYSKSTTTSDNALGTQTTTTQNSPGQVKNLNIAVLVDKSAKNLNVAGISALVKSGAGFNAARGDSLSVQAMPFDQSQQQAAAAQAAAAAKQAAAQAASAQMTGLIKQGVLGLLVLILALGTWIASRKRRKKAGREPDDDLFGLDDDYDDEPTPTAPALGQPTSADAKFAAAQRQSLSEVAENRPEEIARVLSSWLNAKEG